MDFTIRQKTQIYLYNKLQIVTHSKKLCKSFDYIENFSIFHLK